MNKTFQQNTVVHVPNVELFGFMIDYAKSKNVPVHTTKDAWGDGYRNLNFYHGELCGNSADFLSNSYKYEWITIEEFFNYCDNWKNNVIQLTDEYKAEIDKEKKVVKVGCQTIPFDKIKQVYEATLS